jgi:hypothetical protein
VLVNIDRLSSLERKGSIIYHAHDVKGLEQRQAVTLQKKWKTEQNLALLFRVF